MPQRRACLNAALKFARTRSCRCVTYPAVGVLGGIDALSSARKNGNVAARKPRAPPAGIDTPGHPGRIRDSPRVTSMVLLVKGTHTTGPHHTPLMRPHV